MLTTHAITQRADRDGVSASVAERDYVLAHVVAQLHCVRVDGGGRLVFKGGTALRFVHVDNYRYSADLDFTMVGGSPAQGRDALAQAVAAAKERVGFPTLELTDPDPVRLAYVGPLGSAKPRTVKIDLADDEYVENVAKDVMLEDLWSDLPQPLAFDVYPLDEIAAEKLRCVIQRVQCRDLYDLLRLTQDLKVPLGELRPLFEAKARVKALDPAIFRERFEDRIERYRERWNREMDEHLADPPRFDDAERIVRRHLREAGLV